MIKKLVAVIVFVMTASIFVAGCTTQTTPTATPTPTPGDMAAIESYLGSIGYTVVDHFKYNSTMSQAPSDPYYQGNLVKDGLWIPTTIIKAKSNSDAMSTLRSSVNGSRLADDSMGCVKSSSGYKNTTYWQSNCSMLGMKFSTIIFTTDDNWVVHMTYRPDVTYTRTNSTSSAT